MAVEAIANITNIQKDTVPSGKCQWEYPGPLRQLPLLIYNSIFWECPGPLKLLPLLIQKDIGPLGNASDPGVSQVIEANSQYFKCSKEH